MASQGPLSPGTAADDSAVGTYAWDNVIGALADEADNAFTASGVVGTSHYLKVTNFGFSIPDGATIDGVLVEIEYSAGDIGSATENTIKLVVGGSVVGDNKSTSALLSPGYASYGGASVLWGLTPSVAQVNASNFGVVLAIDNNSDEEIAYVDHIRITITYTPAASGPTTQATSSKQAAIFIASGVI